jgi:hypothetical protein
MSLEGRYATEKIVSLAQDLARGAAEFATRPEFSSIRRDARAATSHRLYAWTLAGWADAGAAPADCRQTLIDIIRREGPRKKLVKPIWYDAAALAWLVGHGMQWNTDRRGRTLPSARDQIYLADSSASDSILAAKKHPQWRRHARVERHTDCSATFLRAWARQIESGVQHAVIVIAVIGADVSEAIVVPLRTSDPTLGAVDPPKPRPLARRATAKDLTPDAQRRRLDDIERERDEEWGRRWCKGLADIPTMRTANTSDDANDAASSAAWAPMFGANHAATILALKRARERAEAVAWDVHDRKRKPAPVPAVAYGDRQKLGPALILALAATEPDVFAALAKANVSTSGGSDLNLAAICAAIDRTAETVYPGTGSVWPDNLAPAVLGRPGDGRRVLAAAVAALVGVSVKYLQRQNRAATVRDHAHLPEL